MKEDSDAYWNKLKSLDYGLQIAVSKFTGGISPASLMIAFSDWYFHLLIQPSKQIELLQLHQNNMLHLIEQYFGHLSGDASGEYCAITTHKDKRFVGKSWQKFPYTFYYESFLLLQSWWHNAAMNVHGVSNHHENVVDFTIRQFLDMLSPSNSIFTNPEVQEATLEQKGENFIRGMQNFLDDFERKVTKKSPVGSENFIVGKNVATSLGKVIYRNKLIELIQYEPCTKKVYPEPVLITPAWIMKYYILDLIPKHSLVKYLVDKGHTVFMISWKNPTKKDEDLSMENYLNLGIMSALNIISTIVSQQKIHLVGYCLGGTLAAIATATLVRDEDCRLASMTLLAAQTDFNDPGELGLFIDESQIAFLESMMKEKGYLDAYQMAGAFQLLRSNDLIWSRLLHDYLLGVRKPLTDLMSWNADATRMPYKMHSEYLRKLFLHNELAEGQFLVEGQPIALTDISLPIFVVATERDHVSPWHSVFKINLLTDSDLTFVLTSGGHNVGIVSMPTTSVKHQYRITTFKKGEHFIDADNWYIHTEPKEGSWWAAFEKWLADHSSKKINPPEMGCKKEGIIPLESAPGSYVMQK